MSKTKRRYNKGMVKLEQSERIICKEAISFPSKILVPLSSFPEGIMIHCIF